MNLLILKLLEKFVGGVELQNKMFTDNHDKIANLLKKATQKKRANEIDAAILYLKKAYFEIAKTQIDYSVEVFLRLPLYLQAAKKNTEAWNEFENLLRNGYPNQNSSEETKPMIDAVIYDKMRLFLQRNNQFIEAVSYGVYSILLIHYGLFLQKRFTALSGLKEKILIKEKIEPILKKAARLDLVDKVSDLIINKTNSFPQMPNFNEIQKFIN